MAWPSFVGVFLNVDHELGQDQADAHRAVGRDQDRGEVQIELPSPAFVHRRLHLLDEVVKIARQVDHLRAVVAVETPVNEGDSVETSVGLFKLQPHVFFSGRLCERWAGASLKAAIVQAVKPHASADRFSYQGADIDLSSKTALAVTMAIHELATNALKYAAWSNDTGRIDVTCEIYVDSEGRPRFRLMSTETGGPVVEEPTKRGFGSRLITRGLAGEIAGSVELSFWPTGLICVVDASNAGAI